MNPTRVKELLFDRLELELDKAVKDSLPVVRFSDGNVAVLAAQVEHLLEPDGRGRTFHIPLGPFARSLVVEAPASVKSVRLRACWPGCAPNLWLTLSRPKPGTGAWRNTWPV